MSGYPLASRLDGFSIRFRILFRRDFFQLHLRLACAFDSFLKLSDMSRRRINMQVGVKLIQIRKSRQGYAEDSRCNEVSKDPVDVYQLKQFETLPISFQFTLFTTPSAHTFYFLPFSHFTQTLLYCDFTSLHLTSCHNYSTPSIFSCALNS